MLGLRKYSLKTEATYDSRVGRFYGAQRTEVLAAVLLIALLVWDLIEHAFRQHLAAHHHALPGWNNKPTNRPAAFTVSTTFAALQVDVLSGPGWAKPSL